MKQKLGKVMITPKGEWDSTATYEHLDIVNSGGASWLAKRANTAITPVEGDDWMQISKDGEVTKDSVVEALGYEPDGGVWEKICEYTATEATDNIIISKDNDGNAFSLKKLYAVFDFQPTATYSGTNFYFGSKNYSWLGIISTIKRVKTVLAYAELVTAGKCIGWCCYGDNEKLYSATMYTSGVNNCNSTITSFATYLGEKFPAGMTITIYGIRAT